MLSGSQLLKGHGTTRAVVELAAWPSATEMS